MGQSRSPLQGVVVDPALGLPAIVVWLVVEGTMVSHAPPRRTSCSSARCWSQAHPPSRLWFTRELSRSEILNLRRAQLLTGTSIKVTSKYPASYIMFVLLCYADNSR